MEFSLHPIPLVLGVTGGIASGKSTVARRFAELGAAVVSADQLAREAVAPGSGALRQLVSMFGRAILLEDGSLDRERLGGMVFADPAARLRLEQVMHPAIAALAENRLADLRRGASPLVVYEAPLLFEAGADRRVDRVLTVWVDPAVQFRRLCARDRLDGEEARRRIVAQWPQEVKVVRAQELLDNSGPLDQTLAAVDRLFARLLSERAIALGRC